MSDVIIYQNDDGRLSIVYPVAGIPMEEVIAKSIPEGRPYKIIDSSKLPARDEFRNAWKNIGSGIVFDLPVARELKMAKIREKRNEKLEETDIPMLKALERGESVDTLKELRQRLRDLPQVTNLEQYTTIKQLRDMWPSEL